MAHSISSARWLRNFALRALLRTGLLYALSHSAPYRLRIKSRRAKPRGDFGLYVLRYVVELTSGRPLPMSTRHLLIRTEAGSSVRLLGLFSSVLRFSLVFTVVVGIVVCAVRMGSAGFSILCMCVPGGGDSSFLIYPATLRWMYTDPVGREIRRPSGGAVGR